MTKHEFQLGCGIRLHAVQTSRFKVSRLSLSFICEADRINSPLTKLMFSVLMRGSEKYPAVIQINERLDELYGSTVSFRCMHAGRRHIFKIICEFLDDRYLPKKDMINTLSGTLEVIEDILFHPKRDENGLLDEIYIESEKKIAADGIRAKINDQKAYSAERCRQIMFEDDPCGISIDGTEDLINGFDISDIERCLRKTLEDAAIECFYVGPETGKYIADCLVPFFSNISHRGGAYENYSYIPFCSEAGLSDVTEKLHVSHGRLNIGLTCDTVLGDEKYFAMCLLNEIYGGSSVSKLFLNVREKKSLCYYCESDYIKSSGVILVSCGIKPENRDVAYAEIVNQLEKIKNGDFSDEDINYAKKIVINSLKQTGDSAGAIEAFYFSRMMAGKDMNVEYCLEKINEVTKKEIADCAELVKPKTVFFLCGEDTI